MENGLLLLSGHNAALSEVRKLEECDIMTPAAIGAALGMLVAEATKMLRGHQWREGDVARLEAAAVGLGVQMPG